MEANEFFRQKFIAALDHQERGSILFLLVERRVRLNGTLMVALRVKTPVGIGSLYVLLLGQRCRYRGVK